MSNEFAEKFPETGWLCPYCLTECTDESAAMVDRRDIPTHLIYSHGWESEKLTWEYIYNRLSLIGGI